MSNLKPLNLLTLAIVILAGLNWGLVGIAHLDIVAMIFGAGTMAARVVYIVVGLSAIWQLLPFFESFSSDEPSAERGRMTPGR